MIPVTVKKWLSAAAATVFVVASASSAATPPTAAAPTVNPLHQLTPAQRNALQKALKGSSLPAVPSVPGDKPVAEPTTKAVEPPTPSEESPGGLRSFGYDYFSQRPDTTALSADLPVPDEYVVGPGDMLLVQLYGKDNVQYELPVTREGVVQFPGIGPIHVGGKPFSKVRELVTRRVQGQFIGLKASVQIGRLRNIQIFVLGDVVRPGSYTVSGLATLTNAILASGGVKKIGSLRQIQLKRQGKLVGTLDLYELLLKGDNSGDARLQPGDVIFIPPIGKTAGITGEIKRPAIYELKSESTLDELVALAGGLTAEAYPHTMQIERIQDNRDRTVIDIDMTQAESGKTTLVSGDVVRVFEVSDVVQRIVTLSGYTSRAGSYQWTEGMRLTQLIPSLADLPTEVDAHYQVIRREDPKTRSIEMLSADAGAALAAPESDANIKLLPRDTVYLFSIHDNRRAVLDPLLKQVRAQSRPDRLEREVTIEGSVHHPGRYPFAPGMRLGQLLNAGGGLTDKAFTLEAELTRYSASDGKERKQETTVISLVGTLAADGKNDPELKPYDQVVIRRIPNWTGEGYISIQGNVSFPGRYPIAPGEKLSSVLKRAGGVTPNGFARGALFLRDSVRVREQQFLDRVARELEEQILLASAQQPEVAKDKKESLVDAQALLKQIRATKAVGRVAIRLDDIIKGDEDQDVTLQDGDALLVPLRPSEVTVTGQVYFPTSHLYVKGGSRDDYVAKSGGVTERGNGGDVYVVHADGSVSAGGGWFSFSPRIGPGDTVVVPYKIDRVSALKVVGDVTQILYQLAVAAAALKVLSAL